MAKKKTAKSAPKKTAKKTTKKSPKKTTKKPARKPVKKTAAKTPATSAKPGGVQPIPPGGRSVTPYLVVRGAQAAIDFYRKAFGAEEVFRMASPDGQMIMHAEFRIGDSNVMICDEMPQMQRLVSPQSLNGTTVRIHLYLADVDSVFERAVAAGAKVSMPLSDMFWGDRMGKVTDPYGHEWSLATHKKDMTPEEVQKGMKAYLSGMEQAAKATSGPSND